MSKAPENHSLISLIEKFPTPESARLHLESLRSAQHMDRYLAEISFRWDTRDLSDGERTNIALLASDGKRLMYKELAGIAKAA